MLFLMKVEMFSRSKILCFGLRWTD